MRVSRSCLKFPALKNLTEHIKNIFWKSVKNYVEPMFPLPVVFLVFFFFFLIHTVCFPHEPIIRIVDTVYESL